ncbi:MAG: hypothetical protein K0S44_1806 [Bacteroidetes bacterium]|jgi:hypothetical protein|nr:hypothetical protein [Bacteroidota bacterium]
MFGQTKKESILPMTAGTIQFAGSTGFLTAGFFKGTKSERVQVGLLYGYTPEIFGGHLHSLSLKFIYNPVRFDLGRNFYSEPVQAGIFACQNFGKNLDLTWPSQYPSDYYWWTASLRGHVFLSTTLGVRTNRAKHIDRIAWYFEANTNDLYFASYIIKNNHTSLSLYDIIFFGTGLKFYFKSPNTKE